MWEWKSARGSEVVDISILGPKWMRFPVRSHVILLLTTWLVSTLTVKLFSDTLPRSSAEALWLMKRNKAEKIKIRGWEKSKSEEMEQRNVKFPATESLNCSLQNLLSTILSMIFQSETLIFQNYWHSGKRRGPGCIANHKMCQDALAAKKGAKSQQ